MIIFMIIQSMLTSQMENEINVKTAVERGWGLQ